MRVVLAGAALVVVALCVAPDARAAKCADTDATVVAARAAIQEKCGCGEDKRAFKSCLKSELKARVKDKSLTKPCSAAVRRIFGASICGRAGVTICCEAKGNRRGKIVPAGKAAKKCKKGDVCSDASRTSVGGAFFSTVNEVCSAQSSCNPVPTTTTTSTTSTSVTSVSTSTTTSTTVLCDFNLDFAVTAGTGACGQVSGDVAGTQKLIDLTCGDLNIGGGGAAAPPGGPIPDGSVNQFCLRECTNDVCQVAGGTQTSDTIDCTNTTCNFGLPLPIFGSPFTCVLNTFAAPASGTFNLATGTTDDLNVSLSSAIFSSGTYYVDRGAGTVAEPCPVCVDSVDLMTGFHPLAGSPNDPRTGLCGGGPRAGQPCTTRNSSGLTHDCLPGGTSLVDSTRQCAVGEGCEDAFGQTASNLGAISVSLSPLRTSSVAVASQPVNSVEGFFCQNLTPPQDNPGCFNAEFLAQLPSGPEDGGDCRHIAAVGTPFGDLRPRNPLPGVLASVFCIPQTSADIINIAADLPGPGQVTLVGTMTVGTVPATTTTSSTVVTTTTTSTTEATTSTTEATTTTTSSTTSTTAGG